MHNTSTFREQWKENRRSVVKHSTYCAYVLILKTHLMPVFADAVSISEAEVQQFALFDILSRSGRISRLTRFVDPFDEASCEHIDVALW